LYNKIKKYYAPSTSHNGGCNIDVSNCEHYFLLYIDNELNALDKKNVEQFLQQNPSTQAIFNELQETILLVDTIEYNKEALYKKIDINENNYEQYIISQLNGETTVDEDNAIENFISQHAHLQQKIGALQHTKLIAEKINFNKATLYKTASVNLQGASSITELMLLNLDKQTTPEQTKAVQQLIKTNEGIANEWQLLQNTIIPLETVAHPNKESLYKKENRKKPVIAMWLRYAAVACLLLGVTYTTLQLNNDSKPKVNNGNVVANNNDTITKLNTVVANNNPQANKNLTQLVKKLTNTTISKNVIVKNELTPNKIVTNINNLRITNTTGSKKVLTINENNIIIENKVDEQNALVTTSTTIDKSLPQLPAISHNLQSDAAALQQSVEVNYYVEQNESNVSFLSIDTDKLDKKNRLGKLKNRVVAMLKEKTKSLGNDVTIAGYSVAFAKAR
jgi:hypothetical protein